eukprot:c32476_g1_i1.p1 GENE.c32476_g1_i1~~c32476_g1_i1.p1  ORF type:complete len:246 (+),score=39.14 c32476_g1_i1:62-739(+)
MDVWESVSRASKTASNTTLEENVEAAFKALNLGEIRANIQVNENSRVLGEIDLHIHRSDTALLSLKPLLPDLTRVYCWDTTTKSFVMSATDSVQVEQHVIVECKASAEQLDDVNYLERKDRLTRVFMYLKGFKRSGYTHLVILNGNPDSIEPTINTLGTKKAKRFRFVWAPYSAWNSWPTTILEKKLEAEVSARKQVEEQLRALQLQLQTLLSDKNRSVLTEPPQ